MRSWGRGRCAGQSPGACTFAPIKTARDLETNRLGSLFADAHKYKKSGRGRCVDAAHPLTPVSADVRLCMESFVSTWCRSFAEWRSEDALVLRRVRLTLCAPECELGADREPRVDLLHGARCERLSAVKRQIPEVPAYMLERCRWERNEPRAWKYADGILKLAWVTQMTS